METRTILIISTVVFSCGFLGLITVRLTNPFFKGLGWVAAAFAAGSLGAVFFTFGRQISAGSGVIVPDTLILLAYVFLQVCILEMAESPSLLPRLGLCLLAAQGLVYCVVRNRPNAEQICVIALGLAVAAQALETAALLRRYKDQDPGMTAPAWFTAALLTAFAFYNIFRTTIVLTFGTVQNPQAPNPLETVSALVFLGVGLGLGFGVFWMATTHIRLALEGLANSDPLTGIHNRRAFTSCCEKELARSTRSSEPFSLILFDLDHFKRINDRYGHATGDVVLCAVVEKLRNAVRNIDLVARWGGEEFIALLPKADPDAALLVAQRLRRSVESISVAKLRSDMRLPSSSHASFTASMADDSIPVTISIGVATYTGQPTTIADLLHECDSALYQAKAQGRNRVVAMAIPRYALFS